MEAPNYSKDQINEKIYKLDLLMEEIEDQKQFFKKYGSILNMICSIALLIQKRLWMAIAIGVVATYLGVTL